MQSQQQALVFTASGSMLDLLNPNPVDIRIEDIAHQLAMQPRYAGATRFPYSVAQHSVLVAQACPPGLRLWGLLHDAAEAFLGDLVAPIKPRMDQYVRAEIVLMRAICVRFGLQWPEPVEVKEFDQTVAALEMRCLLRGHKPGRGEVIKELTWREARDEFMQFYSECRLVSAEIVRLLQLCSWHQSQGGKGRVVYENAKGSMTVELPHPAQDLPECHINEIFRVLAESSAQDVNVHVLGLE